ncbi:BH4_AAA_HYDROXYL_2 domain-containing protein [Meloidogyne graminicola]|uniref:BH4_AAA_HYDROXYL_2 domain-containing protein n=2 Tax=Meloidogyne TaxID=189290 RepID=A0A8S9ZRX2_9BILA|nr:BH4_AAA_HYDROXYL_2 domain-containing protein [Meloidogyne graminicola]
MASGMKFLYYNQKTPIRRTVSSNNDGHRLEELKKRFRRSGSLGFRLLTIVIRSQKGTQSLINMLNEIPKTTIIRHFESRDPKDGEKNELEVLLELELNIFTKTEEIFFNIQKAGFNVREINRTVAPHGALEPSDPGSIDALSGAPWFPKSIYDLDICSKRVIMYGAGGLDADHPGFKDKEYRQRRMMFADIAINYKQGEPIPRIEFTETEKQTWKTIYQRHCGYSENNIPQLQDVNNFLKAKTGFRVRPVAGYLSARDFLAGLAFRVFNCTQYIRHHADPFYTPEPDTVHELMGHMALFADPDFAQFSQEIGLASLGASDEDLTLFFSIEFGLCSDRSNKNKLNYNNLTKDSENKIKYKIYGAGLLSSASELQHAVEGNSQILRFDPDRVVQQECLISTFQTAYFFTHDFEEAQQKLRILFSTFTSNMNRPFVVRYNPYTESVEVLNNKRSLMLAVNSLRSDINLLASSLHNIL